jgi:tRNA(adenine34) deaminase
VVIVPPARMVDDRPMPGGRRAATTALIAGIALGLGARAASSAERADPAAHGRWMGAAFAMKRLAESRGDQPYGAVVVVGGEVAGEGPSRVVERGDAEAHAEREAIRDAQRRLGRTRLEGGTLYSTSRPCPRCERAAAEAGIARMIHGIDLRDAGAPRP